jgi:outer membrane immunogenic protein
MMTKVVKTAPFGTVMLLLACVTAAHAGQAQGASTLGPNYDWTGLQVGAHVGDNWSHTDSQTINTVNGAAEGSSSSTDASHVNGGIQGGYDYMMPSRVVVGAFTALSAWGLNDTSTTSIGTNVHTNQSKTNWAGSVVGRLGYGLGRVLVYGTGGWAWSTGSTTRTQVTGQTGTAVPGTVESLSTNHSGWTAGGGLAYAVSTHVRVVGEYRYSPGSTTITFPLAQRSTSSSTTNNGIQIAVNYRF